MERVQPKTLPGFMELLPGPQAKMERLLDVLRQSYSLYGFAALDTPIIEDAGVLLAKGGGDTEKQIYRLTRGDNELALRFDLTVPLAKYVALNYAKLTFPFRRYQIGKVYRGERNQRGRYREFYQADIDIIGDGELGIMSEAEIPAIICHTFRRLGLEGFQIRINNRRVLSGLFAILGLSSQAGEVMRTVDKMEKIGTDKTRATLCELDVSDAATDELLAFIGAEGSNAQKLSFLEKWRGQNDIFDRGLDELAAVVRYLPAFGVEERHCAIDLTIARGLDYYTGTVYETRMLAHPEIGSICSGGRYDDLAQYYTDKKLPGVGISIGVTRLFFVLEEQGLLSDALIDAPADALVIPMTEDWTFAIEAATALRGAGIRTQIYTEQKKFKAKIGYADKQAMPFALFVGEDEIAAAEVTVKDMVSGAQHRLSVEAAARHMLEALAPRRAATVIDERKENHE